MRNQGMLLSWLPNDFGSNLLNGYVFWLALCQLEGPDSPGLNLKADLAAAQQDIRYFFP